MCDRDRKILNEEKALERSKEQENYLGVIDSLEKFDELCDNPYIQNYVYDKNECYDIVRCKSTKFMWRKWRPEHIQTLDKYDSSTLNLWQELAGKK